MVESVSESLLNITLSITFILMAVIMSRGYHSTCANGWAISILKALGIQLLSGCILVAITAPMLYWDKQSRRRLAYQGKPDKQTIPGTIAQFVGPWSLSGMALQAIMSYTLYRYFISDCAQF